MRRYLHKFGTNEQRSQFESGINYLEPYTSLVYEDDTVYYNVFKAQLTLSDCKTITIPQNGNNTDSALTSAETAEYKADIVDVVVGNRVKTLGNGVFLGCSKLENIEIPNSVTTIGSSTFTNCSKITEIKIPSGVTNINSYTFSGCSNLVSVELPNGLTGITGTDAFRNCSKLTNIPFPIGLKSI